MVVISEFLPRDSVILDTTNIEGVQEVPIDILLRALAL